MKKNNLYFLDGDEQCLPLKAYLDNAKDDGEDEITLYEAEVDTDSNDMCWCTFYCSPVEKYDCNKSCPAFKREKGRFCNYRGKLYTYGDTKVFNVNTGREIIDK